MDQKAPTPFGFRMRQLPKPEYRLMQAMIKQYALDDPCELFTCLLRLGYETLYAHNGEQYWLSIIATWRNNKTEARTYELPG